MKFNFEKFHIRNFIFIFCINFKSKNFDKFQKYSQLHRVKRQQVVDPQLIPGPLGVLSVPIPTNIGFFPGKVTA